MAFLKPAGNRILNTPTFDLEALIRAVGLSLGVGLIAGGVGYFVMRKRAEWSQWKSVLFMCMAGVLLLLTIGIYYAWPTLVRVPLLDSLSQAQAEDLLAMRGLRAEARPQYIANLEAGRVVPHSQSLAPELPVRPGTLVSFAVSLRDDQRQGGGDPLSGLAVALFQPKSGENVRCSLGADNTYRFEVRGTSSGVSTDRLGLLLWLRPVNPSSDTPGWYLQRPPTNGVHKIESDGSWFGVSQLGNAQWPPHAGDTFDLAVTVTDNETISKLSAERGVVVRDQPIGSKSDVAQRVVVVLK